MSTLSLSHDLLMVSVATDLLNVFEVFLPQLLLYPNPSDPLNGDAASLMMKDRKQYDQKVKGEILLLCKQLFFLLCYIGEFSSKPKSKEKRNHLNMSNDTHAMYFRIVFLTFVF